MFPYLFVSVTAVTSGLSLSGEDMKVRATSRTGSFYLVSSALTRRLNLNNPRVQIRNCGSSTMVTTHMGGGVNSWLITV